MHLLREAVHLVEEQKPLLVKVIKLYESPLCQRVCLGHQREQRFVTQRFASQTWTWLASGCQRHIQLSSFHSPRDPVGHVLHKLQSHFRIVFVELLDQLREHIRGEWKLESWMWR